MKNKVVRVATIQTKVGDDLEQNLIKTVELVKDAAKGGAQIICLQELFRTPYFPQYRKQDKEKYVESIPGISTDVFKKIAKEYKVVIIVPIYEKEKTKKPARNASGITDAGGGFEYHNSAVVIDEKGKLLSTYRKVHIPHDPGFYEKDYFKESDNGYKLYKTKFGTFAVLICFDQWFPEAARSVRLLGAEMIFYPTAIGNVVGYTKDEDWHEAWEIMQRAHAIANSLYVIGVNRVGVEGKIEFFGQSFVADPFGKILTRASKNKEEITVTEIDLSRNAYVAEDWGFLRNRRPDTYKTLTKDVLIEKGSKLKNAKAYKDLKKSLEK
ncbi:MAG: carbon-nitrogen hydrolase [Patescibacteria group bacterium]